MVGKEIVTEVYEFIKKNANCTKSEVERGCLDVCTRLPIREAIETLMSDKDGTVEPKVKFSKNGPKGFYRLYVNDNNEFNKLTSQIDQVEKLANDVSRKGDKYLSTAKKTVIKDTSLKKYTLNLIQAAQITIYGRITAIVADIEKNIGSNTDREVLYLRLPAVLAASNKLNEIIMPEIIRSFEYDYEESRKLHLLKRTTYSKIAAEIGCLMTGQKNELMSLRV